MLDGHAVAYLILLRVLRGDDIGGWSEIKADSDFIVSHDGRVTNTRFSLCFHG